MVAELFDVPRASLGGVLGKAITLGKTVLEAEQLAEG